MNYDDLRWLRANQKYKDLLVLTDKTGRPAIGSNLDTAHIAMTYAMPEHIAENYQENIAGREGLAFPNLMAKPNPFGGKPGGGKIVNDWTRGMLIDKPLPPKPKGKRNSGFKWGSMNLPRQDPIYQGRIDLREEGGFGEFHRRERARLERNKGRRGAIPKDKPKIRDMWAMKFGVGDKLSKPRGLYLAGADPNWVNTVFPSYPKSDSENYEQTRDIEIKDLVERLKEHGRWNKKQRESGNKNLIRIGDSVYENEHYSKQLYDMLNARPKLDLATISTGTNFPLQIRTLGGENYDEAGDYRNKNILSHHIAAYLNSDPDQSNEKKRTDRSFEEFKDILEDI